ncbi:hypothetical protein KPP03845_105615 [Streptomyces xanthophaeus]|nr:hypothetical protein KPP03845_105615 [Streptomyces xanthophaeus]
MWCVAWRAAQAVAGRAADRERGVPRSGCLRRRACRPGPEGHGPAARLGRSSGPARGRTAARTPVRRGTGAGGAEPRGEVLDRGHGSEPVSEPATGQPRRRPCRTPSPEPPAHPPHRPRPGLSRLARDPATTLRAAETRGLISRSRNATATPHPSTGRAGPAWAGAVSGCGASGWRRQWRGGSRAVSARQPRHERAPHPGLRHSRHARGRPGAQPRRAPRAPRHPAARTPRPLTASRAGPPQTRRGRSRHARPQPGRDRAPPAARVDPGRGQTRRAPPPPPRAGTTGAQPRRAPGVRPGRASPGTDAGGLCSGPRPGRPRHPHSPPQGSGMIGGAAVPPRRPRDVHGR